MKSAEEYLQEMVSRHPELEGISRQISEAYEVLRKSYESGGKLLTCGNGGSAADAEHIVGELMKGFHLKRPLGQERKEQLGEMAHHLQEALPAIPLTQNQVLSTAYANDVEPDMIFAQQVYGYGQDGDVLIALTTSGNSKNVFCAAEVAVKKHMKVIGFTGAGGGRLKEVRRKLHLFRKNTLSYITRCVRCWKHIFLVKRKKEQNKIVSQGTVKNKANLRRITV